MSNKITFNPTPETKGIRLDIFLSQEIGVSRAQVQKLIRSGRVTVGGQLPKKPGDPLNRASAIEIRDEAKKEEGVRLADRENTDEYGVAVVADTPEYVVVEKPAGLLVHPTEANEPVSLVNWILEKYPEIRGVGDDARRPGIVHRLDKEASGLMVIAKTQRMFDHLKAQFQARTIEKRYAVLVHGAVAKDHDIITFAIDRGEGGRMVSRPKTDPLTVAGVAKEQPGKEAITECTVEKRFTRFTLLSVKIHTGRTHQIRVHMFAYNHPVVGDTIYMNKKLNLRRDQELGRLFLHATMLGFTSPEGEAVSYVSRLPDELQVFLTALR